MNTAKAILIVLLAFFFVQGDSRYHRKPTYSKNGTQSSSTATKVEDGSIQTSTAYFSAQSNHSFLGSIQKRKRDASDKSSVIQTGSSECRYSVTSKCGVPVSRPENETPLKINLTTITDNQKREMRSSEDETNKAILKDNQFRRLLIREAQGNEPNHPGKHPGHDEGKTTVEENGGGTSIKIEGDSDAEDQAGGDTYKPGDDKDKGGQKTGYGTDEGEANGSKGQSPKNGDYNYGAKKSTTKRPAPGRNTGSEECSPQEKRIMKAKCKWGANSYKIVTNQTYSKWTFCCVSQAVSDCLGKLLDRFGCAEDEDINMFKHLHQKGFRDLDCPSSLTPSDSRCVTGSGSPPVSLASVLFVPILSVFVVLCQN